jgi:hypothetical protein
MPTKHQERRYTIEDSSQNVEESLTRALIQRRLASFAIALSDVYEGELPIPPEIERRDIDFSVLRLSLGPKGSLSAFGLTPENAGVTVSVPKDREEKSTLRLVDATRHKPIRKRIEKRS